jgi:hypothetical protein
MVSEYALGDYRWVLSIMFLAWAAGSVTLFFAVRSQIRTLGGKIGLGALLISAVGAGMASIFDVSHNLHGLATIVGIPPFLIAAMLISAGLLRDPAWAPARLPMLLTANLTWISFVLLLAAMFIGFSQTGGEAGPSVLIGWPNRLLIVACCGWLILTARMAIQIDRDNS